MDGINLPYQQALENEWGMSVVERIFDRLTSYDSTSVGAAPCLQSASAHGKIKELRKIIAMGGKPFEALLKQMDMVRQFQTNEGMSLFDAEDTFETHSYSFAGLSDLLSEFKEDIAGAVGIPWFAFFASRRKGFQRAIRIWLTTTMTWVPRRKIRYVAQFVCSMTCFTARSLGAAAGRFYVRV
jgi:phage-related protein (TIGR01555 family)